MKNRVTIAIALYIFSLFWFLPQWAAGTLLRDVFFVRVFFALPNIILVLLVPSYVVFKLVKNYNSVKDRPPGWMFGFPLYAGFVLLFQASINPVLKILLGGTFLIAGFYKGSPGQYSKRREYTDDFSGNSSSGAHTNNARSGGSHASAVTEKISKAKAYEILNVSEAMSQNEIKEVFRKLAHIYHPDHSKDPHANEKFIRINEAYEYLAEYVFDKK